MKRALVLLAALSLGGCISLLPKSPPPPRTFMLRAGDVARAEGPRIDAVVAVSQPGGDPAVLGNALVWTTGDEVAYVNQTQWSSQADDGLRALLIETLSRQGRFSAASRSGESGAGFAIAWDVLSFQIDSAGMTAHFSADVRIMQSPGRRLIAHDIISAEAPVSSRSQTAAAEALARAAREGSARIGVFAAEAAAQARAAAPDQDSAASINR